MEVFTRWGGGVYFDGFKFEYACVYYFCIKRVQFVNSAVHVNSNTTELNEHEWTQASVNIAGCVSYLSSLSSGVDVALTLLFSLYCTKIVCICHQIVNNRFDTNTSPTLKLLGIYLYVCFAVNNNTKRRIFISVVAPTNHHPLPSLDNSLIYLLICSTLECAHCK